MTTKPLPALVLAAVALGAAGCGRAVMVTPPEVSAETAAQCETANSALPLKLVGEQRIETMPDPTTTAAWGAPAIVWRCGVPVPQSLQPTSQLAEVDGAAWLPETLSDGTRFTAVRSQPVVELTIPAEYGNPAAVLAELQAATAALGGGSAPQ